MDLGPSSSCYQVISCSSSGNNGWLKSEFGLAPLLENSLLLGSLGITAPQGEGGMLGKSCTVAGTTPASCAAPGSVWVRWELPLDVLSTGRAVLTQLGGAVGLAILGPWPGTLLLYMSQL